MYVPGKDNLLARWLVVKVVNDDTVGWRFIVDAIYYDSGFLCMSAVTGGVVSDAVY